MAQLCEICDLVNTKVKINEEIYKDLMDSYISTENMLPNKGGVIFPAKPPKTGSVTAYECHDILVSNIRPYFKKIWYANKNGTCSNDVLVFRAKEGVLPDYLYYILSSDSFFEYSMKTSKGTKMPRGDKASIMKYVISCLDYNTQKKATIILKLIDKKIELNNKINKNLFHQLSTIFKHWFTNNPQLSSMTQVPLADLCLVITKGTTPTTLGRPFVSGGINFIKAESILDSHTIDKNKFAFIDIETNDLLKRSIIYSGDIIFTIAGTLGRFALVDDSILPANTNQAVAIIRADKKKVTSEYLYSFFLGNWHNDYYTKRIQQAVQANLSLGTIKSLPIPILSDSAMSEYLGIISPIITMTKSNELEITKLKNIRDTLLPQLMSGELDVSSIDL